MYEVVWQYDSTTPFRKAKPENAAEARRLLIEGNQTFCNLFAPHTVGGEVTRQLIRIAPQDVGLGARPGEAPTQEPFAAFLSCADARAPVELIFSQQANDLFVVRVAGNVLGDESLGSLGYAVDQLGSVRLLAVMGHTGCGAVTAAVDAHLSPVGYLDTAAKFPLDTIIAKIMAPVNGAAFALARAHGDGVTARPGYRAALIDAAVMLNTALSAAALGNTFDYALGERLQVSFGVYDLRQRNVGLPDGGGEWQTGLFPPPTTRDDFDAFALRVARSGMITGLLGNEG